MFPRKFTSTRKPHSPKLDRSHPLYKHITMAFMFIEGKTINLKAQEEYTQIDVSYPRDVIAFDGTAGNKVALNDPFDFPNNEGTLICRVNAQDATKNEAIISDKNVANWTASDGFNFNIRTSGGLIFKQGNNQAITATDYFHDGGWHSFFGRYKSGDLMEAYVDNVEIGYDSQSTATNYTQSSINTRIGTYYDESALRSSAGEIDYILVFDKKLTVDQCKSLTSNPYQILQPRTQLLPLTIGAAPTGFKSAWAMASNRSGMIGAR